MFGPRFNMRSKNCLVEAQKSLSLRLQKLLGHATPHMTLRYMQHAPEAYFAEDAARIAASLSGAAPDREAATRSELAREQLKSV